MPKPIDSDFAALLRDYLAEGVFREGSAEARVVAMAAAEGLGSLNEADRLLWSTRVLPILSKPLDEQAAVASILRNGGYVPAKVTVERQPFSARRR